jgi:peroxiredoxin
MPKSKQMPKSKRMPKHQQKRRAGWGRGPLIAAGVGILVVALAGIYLLNDSSDGNSASSGDGGYAFQVGSPGPGQKAPTFVLSSAAGGTYDLASSRGKSVLLYFQEGITCQPCWDQLKDIEAQMARFKSLGVDQVVSITTDPVDSLAQKTADEGITSPVLADPDLTVSRQYQANSYGMMGDSRDGHSFILVGPDRVIQWRADYGGPPDFTMYLPVDALLADLRAGMTGGG